MLEVTYLLRGTTGTTGVPGKAKCQVRRSIEVQYSLVMAMERKPPPDTVNEV